METQKIKKRINIKNYKVGEMISLSHQVGPLLHSFGERRGRRSN
jgi:hypothetical protein